MLCAGRRYSGKSVASHSAENFSTVLCPLVKTITYCHDTYRVTTADGKTRAFWERNLRFRTDSSKDGPEKGAPAITPAGMMGDRASVIFAAPEEINKIIEARC